MSKRYRVYFDGGCQAAFPGGPTNPGGILVGGWHFSLYDEETEEDKVLVTGGCVFHDWRPATGQTTNNQAEYLALIAALEQANDEYQLQQMDVHGDSELVIRQLTWLEKKKKYQYQTKDPVLVALREQVLNLIDGKEVTFTHIPRELNRMSDEAGRRAFASWKKTQRKKQRSAYER